MYILQWVILFAIALCYFGYGLFEASSIVRRKWYKRFLMFFLWPLVYFVDWLDEQEYGGGRW